MNRRPGRNDPCPCGSGRKYKNCCEGKARVFGRKVPSAAIWIVLAIAVLGVGAYAMLRSDRSEPTASSVVPPGERPAPYTYDSLRNQHFDPVHGHWHDGRPPVSAGASASGPAAAAPAPGETPTPAPTPAAPPASPPATTAPATPAPWTYDAERNQHWDPGHQHWHQGPPPPGH